MRRLVRRSLFVLVGASAAYVIVLAYPQPIFAYELQRNGLTVHATRPIPDAMAATLDRAAARLHKSPLSASAA
jgi:hypothetical protein